MEGEKYIAYTGIIGCQSLEQYIRKIPHGGGECEMSYTSSGAVIVSHQRLQLPGYQWTFAKDRRNHVFLPYTSCAHSVHS